MSDQQPDSPWCLSPFFRWSVAEVMATTAAIAVLLGALRSRSYLALLSAFILLASAHWFREAWRARRDRGETIDLTTALKLAAHGIAAGGGFILIMIFVSIYLFMLFGGGTSSGQVLLPTLFALPPTLWIAHRLKRTLWNQARRPPASTSLESSIPNPTTHLDHTAQPTVSE